MTNNVEEATEGLWAGTVSDGKVTEISSNAFKDFTKLKSVRIGSKVTKIEASAFADCTSLKSVILTSSKLASIGGSAFAGDKALTKVSISSKSLKSIGGCFLAEINEKTIDFFLDIW